MSYYKLLLTDHNDDPLPPVFITERYYSSDVIRAIASLFNCVWMKVINDEGFCIFDRFIGKDTEDENPSS